jgi:hypothetical protein
MCDVTSHELVNESLVRSGEVDLLHSKRSGGTDLHSSKEEIHFSKSLYMQEIHFSRSFQKMVFRHNLQEGAVASPRQHAICLGSF